MAAGAQGGNVPVPHIAQVLLPQQEREYRQEAPGKVEVRQQLTPLKIPHEVFGVPMDEASCEVVVASHAQ